MLVEKLDFFFSKIFLFVLLSSKMQTACIYDFLRTLCCLLVIVVNFIHIM